MDERIVTELPCRYYSYPTKSRGICVILKWTVKEFGGLFVGLAYKFPRVRPTLQYDLEVSFIKNDDTLYLYVENKYESDIHFDATTTIFDEGGKQVYQEAVKDFRLKKKPNILPSLKNRRGLTNALVIEIKLDLYKLNGEIWDMAAWEREKEKKLAEDIRNSIFAVFPAEVILKTKDDEIPANRAMLCARSSVFRRMFDHTLTERDSGIVPIEDLSGSTMKKLVHFLNSGEANLCETLPEALKELYYAADKYEVLDLREICAQTIILMLTKENAIGVLVLAHRHCDGNLKKECLHFFRSSNHIQAIVKTEEWKHLKASVPDLAFEVLETCVQGSNNDQ